LQARKKLFTVTLYFKSFITEVCLYEFILNRFKYSYVQYNKKRETFHFTYGSSKVQITSYLRHLSSLSFVNGYSQELFNWQYNPFITFLRSAIVHTSLKVFHWCSVWTKIKWQCISKSTVQIYLKGFVNITKWIKLDLFKSRRYKT
jgi:hypothetical protein